LCQVVYNPTYPIGGTTAFYIAMGSQENHKKELEKYKKKNNIE